MRIIHFASGDLWAGAEVQLFHLALNINKRDDIDLMVVLLNDGQLAQELRDRKINVVVIDESVHSFFKIAVKFYNISRQFRPDIIHTHRTKENIIGGTVSWLSRCKSIRTVHGASEFSLNIKLKIINAIDNFVACVFQEKVIAVSYELKDKLQAECFRNKVIVIENCIDIEYVHKMAEVENNYNIDKTQFNIAFVGRFVDVKRTDLFVDIAEYIKKQYPEHNIKFHMFGDGPLWETTKDYVEKKGLDNTIKLAGFVSNSAPCIGKMNLLLITSDHEGLPMTLLEAMALKVPVMSRELTTVKHVLCDGECGYVLSSDSAVFFAEKIMEIKNNIPENEMITLKAGNRVENNYSIDSLVDKYMKLYQSVA